MVAVQTWERRDSGLAEVVRAQTEVCLKVYSEDPSRVLQDANNERRVAEGGYATRQLEELLQNAVDAAGRGGGRIEVLLTKKTLYVANDGAPFDEAGVMSVMASDISAKDDERIGKFGIGFKSVLAISDSPRIFSRSVSFGFDKAWSEATLKEMGYKFSNYPTMRLARTLDPDADGAAGDPHLRELVDWATTVVVLPLTVPSWDLTDRIYEFPAQFLLFSPHVETARFRNLAEVDPNGRPGTSKRLEDRIVSQQRLSDGTVRLTDGDTYRNWRVTSVSHRPSASAREDGGYVADRDQVQVQYALPLPPRGDRLGRFWAFFPTHYETTLTGVINAPWKLSDDRTGLLEGAFNRELLTTLPGLFAEAIQALSGTSDAVAVLDAAPARGLEARNWVDRDINEPVFRRLRATPCLPDGDGVLKVPTRLKWIGEVPKEWLAQWAGYEGAPRGDWLHPDAYSSPERRKKISRLMQRDRLDTDDFECTSGIDEWLEALVTDGAVVSSADAVLLADRIVQDSSRTGDNLFATAVQGVREAKIIRLENGEFRAPARGRVFVRVAGDDRTDVDFVDPALAAMPAVRDALGRLGIVVMDRSGELRRLLAEATTARGLREPAAVWPRIWAALREIPDETAIGILADDLGQRPEAGVRVRTAAGSWRPLGQVYVGGRVIPADGSRDRDRLVDPRFHTVDEDLLRELGAVDAPVWRSNPPREAWLSAYEEAMRDDFVEAKSSGNGKPNRDKVEVTPGPRGVAPPWPLAPLEGLSPQGLAAATKHVMSRPPGDPWLGRHSSSQYKSVNLTAPEVWLLVKCGRLPTAFGLRRPRSVLRASEAILPTVLPAVELSIAWASALQVKTDVEELTETDWAELKAIADMWTTADDDRRRADFYSWLPSRLECDRLTARVGAVHQSVEVKNIGVTADPLVYDSMLEAQVPALFVADSDDAQRFVDAWGMPWGKDLLQEELVVDPSGEPDYLTDRFPPLKLRLDPADQELKLQPVSRMVKMIATPRGQVARPIVVRRDSDTLYVTAMTPESQLAQVSTVLGLDLDRQAIAAILQQMAARATDKLRTQIKRAGDDDARLLKAVGVDALRRCVPEQALEVLDGERGGASPKDVAALAKAVHGVGLLKQLRPALEDRGLQPPKEWTGRRTTRQWVTELGFPPDWAGFPGGGRAAVEMIDGPAVLDPLHGYQEFVTDQIKALLRGVRSDRGMVSLPTGSGKTRVTVEALVNAVREHDVAAEMPVIWIAQSDELCEQAAETWTYVWRAIGPRAPMRLGRLWGANEVSEEPGSFQMVIATIDKLDALTARPAGEYEWLREPSVVVVDEAHTSIAPSYTRVLDWLGRSGRGRNVDARRPLLGLTATPFRGTSTEETERLVRRYDGNRLDRGAFLREDPYEELQDKGVLARVRQEILGGTDVRLTEADAAEIDKMRRLPSAVTERLGADLARTQTVVESICGLPEDWTILVFAPSVDNARVLAALLSHRGVPAVPISADTEPAVRRHYIEEFKAGRIRALTNFSVLAQGFDVPRIQAVYVARPTFSPNVYQQMIGRGLRGPMNGGSEEVLIVNVKDNFAKYGDLLAFKEFEHLWTRR